MLTLPWSTILLATTLRSLGTPATLNLLLNTNFVSVQHSHINVSKLCNRWATRSFMTSYVGPCRTNMNFKSLKASWSSTSESLNIGWSPRYVLMLLPFQACVENKLLPTYESRSVFPFSSWVLAGSWISQETLWHVLCYRLGKLISE